MSLRGKLTLFSVVFLVLFAGFISGSFLIFDRLKENYELLRHSSEEHNLHEELEMAIRDFLQATKEYGLTGERRFRRQSSDKLSAVYKQFGNIGTSVAYREFIEPIGKDFEELRGIADSVLSVEYPVGNFRVIEALRKIETKEAEILNRLNELHTRSVESVSTTIQRGERFNRDIAIYMGAIFAVTSLSFLILIFFMRRMIAVPFNDILTATDRIISGNRTYRIASERNDEFGTIADRFDAMVEELQKINKKNEELYVSTREQLHKLTTMYELAKTITSTLDVGEILRKTAEEATKLITAKGCVIRLIEDQKLVIRASYGIPQESVELMTLAMGEGLPGKVAKEGRPILVDDMGKMPEEWRIPHLDATSAVNVPMIVSDTVIGTFALYDKMSTGDGIVPFSPDDLTTAEGLASMCAIAIEKAKLFELEIQREREAVEAKKRMDVLFDSVQGGIITMKKDFTILSANRYVETWIGIGVETIIGRSSLEVFHGGKGICPHCVAQVTFETGEVNTITQVSGLNYAELTSYPIKDEAGGITECVVFIQDITDRVLYQEEMLSLYREVTETKEYLESLIDNSADAIVTSDLNGVVTSWNNGGERIYGYAEAEAVGRYLPFVPEFLKDAERENTEKIKHGDMIKDIETVRQRKDGVIIQVSLTLSPIKDAGGKVIGICGISRDITEKKSVEIELIKKNQELSRLFFISSAMRSTLEIDRLLRMILTAVTMGDGFGFNRSVLFLVDEARNVLKGAMGVGPANYEEAGWVWGKLSMEKKTLTDVMQDIERGPAKPDTFLDRLSRGLEIPLDGDSLFASAVREKSPFNVSDARRVPASDSVVIQQLGTEAYAIVPLVSRDRTIGIMWVDNFFNKKRITDEDMKFLTAFSNQVAAAIESAKLFEKVSIAEAELENIFRSISDMVYFTDMNYTIKNINRAVEGKLSKPREEIIGRKCYEMFHGLNEPWHKCPHHKTVETRKAHVEEVHDPNLGGTFLTSTSPIFDPSGNFMGTVHVVRDITELSDMRVRLANAERKAALGEVAAKVAHEIRNPLVSIGGFSRRLEKKVDDNLREYASIITKEVQRLETILRDILGFVREVRLSVSSVDLNGLLRDVLSLVETVVAERHIEMEISFGDLPTVLVDPDRVKEAFLNIIKNSIEAVGEGGKIMLRTYRGDGTIIIEVVDTGVGINERDMPFIFDPFFTTKTTGTGLGLAITRRIIEEHGGTIEVKSKIDEGTTIKVSLPAGKEE